MSKYLFTIFWKLPTASSLTVSVIYNVVFFCLHKPIKVEIMSFPSGASTLFLPLNLKLARKEYVMQADVSRNTSTSVLMAEFPLGSFLAAVIPPHS